MPLRVDLERDELSPGRQRPREVQRRDADRGADLDDVTGTDRACEHVQQRAFTRTAFLRNKSQCAHRLCPLLQIPREGRESGQRIWLTNRYDLHPDMVNET